jgi:hypothetical protein
MLPENQTAASRRMMSTNSALAAKYVHVPIHSKEGGQEQQQGQEQRRT